MTTRETETSYLNLFIRKHTGTVTEITSALTNILKTVLGPQNSGEFRSQKFHLPSKARKRNDAHSSFRVERSGFDLGDLGASVLGASSSPTKIGRRVIPQRQGRVTPTAATRQELAHT